MKKQEPLNSYQPKNIEAVLNAYRRGKLKPGPPTDWLDGRKLTEPLDLTDEKMLKDIQHRYGGQIPLWHENVCEST